MVHLPDETKAAAESLFDLLYALVAQMPDLDPALRKGARITFDAHEAAFVIGARNADGTSTPLLAITADPAEPLDFGRVGRPEPYPTSTTWH